MPPDVHDLADRFAEHLTQAGITPDTQRVLTSIVRVFSRWLAAHPEYSDALTDVDVRDKALDAYWEDLKSTHNPHTIEKIQSCLARLFRWLGMPGDVRFGPDPEAYLSWSTDHHGLGTSIVWRDGQPFKAKVMCSDGRLRSTEHLRQSQPDHFNASVSVIKDGKRRKVAGSVVIETLDGASPATSSNPLVVKFIVHEHTINAVHLPYGCYRKRSMQ